MERDSFTRTKLLWIEQVMFDSTLNGSALRVACRLGTHYINREKLYAWCKVETLAQDLGISKRCVQQALRALQEAGHLDIETGGGRTSSRYRWCLQEKARSGDAQAASSEDVSEEIERPSGVKECARGVQERARGVKERSPQPCTNVHPNPLSEPIEDEPSEVDTPYFPQIDLDEKVRRDEPQAASDDPPPDEFEEFWRHYPRRVAKAAARRAWKAASRKAGGGEIIRGAMRYAAERDGQPPKFTKHPATWLNGECWTDEPAPPANVIPFADRPGGGGFQRHVSSMDVANALIAEGRADGGLW